MQGPEQQLSKGDWVFHPRMPDWGYGKVLEVLDENKGRVFFLLAGEKKLSWEHAGLGRVENDTESQAALNDQLAEFKVKLAKDLLTSEEFSGGVTCTPCESFSSECELCRQASSSLRVYSYNKRGKLCLCDACRDRIILEAKDSGTENSQNVLKMENRGKKAVAGGGKKQIKPRAVKK